MSTGVNIEPRLFVGASHTGDESFGMSTDVNMDREGRGELRLFVGASRRPKIHARARTARTHAHTFSQATVTGAARLALRHARKNTRNFGGFESSFVKSCQGLTKMCLMNSAERRRTQSSRLPRCLFPRCL